MQNLKCVFTLFTKEFSMSTFKLQVHSRDLAIAVVGNMASHTGYDLVEYDNNGNVLSIRSVDLIEENGEIRFDISEKRSGKTYIIDGKTQAWPDFIHFGDKLNQEVTQEFAEDNHFYTADVPVVDPQAMFDRIVFDAKFRNALADSNVAGGGINYQALGPNCNTWTNYIGTQFIGINVFNRLPASDGIIYNYVGNNRTFNNCSSPEDVRNCAILEEISRKFFDQYSKNFNFDKLNITLTNAKDTDNITAINGFYAEITDGRKNYIFDCDEGNIITGNSKDNYIIAGKGNDEINAGAGNDVIDAGILEKEAGINKYANLGSGNDIYLGGLANDNVNGVSGNNRVMLGGGSDVYYGGNGVDIVDGGSGRLDIFDGVTNIIGIGNITQDLISDIDTDQNTIKLGGGNDIYYGGIGKDIVDGGSGHDKIFAGDGDNEITGGSGNDIIETGSGNDIIHAGTGRDDIRAGSGNNHIYLGNDDVRDDVWLQNTSGGTDYIYQITANDVIHYNSTIKETKYSGKDVIHILANGSTVVIHDFYDEEPSDLDETNLPAAGSNGAPLIVLPDGSVLGYGSDGQGYKDTGYKLPGEFPGKDGENGEKGQPQGPGVPPQGPGDDTPPSPPEDDPEDPTGEENTPEDQPDGPEDGLKGTGDQPLTQEEIDKGIKNTSGGYTDFYDEIRRLLDELAKLIAQQTRGIFKTAEETRSPLILDLNGNGVETTSTDNGVYFDHDGNGFSEKTAWVSANDGLLVRDINGNGKIDSGAELFGNNTILSNGQKAANGFEALKDLDSNRDGVFNSSDAAWNEVKVWKDSNQNGKVDDGELLTLEQAA